MSDQIRRLYDFELEPEVRDRLETLSDSDFRRVDDVCGLLAEEGSELGGPWSDHLEGPVWELRIRLRDDAAGHGVPIGRLAVLPQQARRANVTGAAVIIKAPRCGCSGR